MKALVTMLVVALLSLPTFLYAGHDDETNITAGPKQRNVFVLKTEKSLVGAHVEIYTSHGVLVTSQSLQRRRMIIDFGNAMTDTYTIRIVKGNTSKEFRYVKQ